MKVERVSLPGSFRAPRRLGLGVAAVAALSVSSAFAGGYLGVSAGGVAWKWTASPIVLNYDQGPLSATVTNATADALVTTAIGRWNNANIPTCSLTFSQGADLVGGPRRRGGDGSEL